MFPIDFSQLVFNASSNADLVVVHFFLHLSADWRNFDLSLKGIFFRNGEDKYSSPLTHFLI